MARNAAVAGTDVYGYLIQLFGFSAFALRDGVVYQTYSTTRRGVEFTMPYYGYLDHAPQGRDETDRLPFDVTASSNSLKLGS